MNSSSEFDNNGKKLKVGRVVLWCFAAFWNIFLLVFWYAAFIGRVSGTGDVWLLYALLGLFQVAGIFLIYLAVMASRHGTTAQKEPQSRVVRSSSKTGLVVAVFLVLLWNGISWITFWVYYTGGSRSEYPILTKIIIAAFILIGAYIAYKVVLGILRVLRFGSIEFVMDPNPASIGGDMGGFIELSVPFSQDNRFEAVLSCVHSVTKGSGKNRTVWESLLWQTEKMVSQEPCSIGTRIMFKFAVPPDLPESEDVSENYKYWSLRLSSNDIPGVDFFERFVVHVKKTEVPLKSSIREDALSSDVPERKIKGVVVSSDPAGNNMLFYPALRSRRNFVAALFMAGFLSIFVYVMRGAIWGGIQQGDVHGYTFSFMTVAVIFIFASLAIVLFFYAIFELFNSLEVVVSSSTMRTVRRVMGIVVKRVEVGFSEVESFECKSTGHLGAAEAGIVTMSVQAKLKSNKKITVGDGIYGYSNADAVKSLFERWVKAHRVARNNNKFTF